MISGLQQFFAVPLSTMWPVSNSNTAMDNATTFCSTTMVTLFGQLLAHVHDVTYDQRSQAFKGFVEQYKTGVAYHGARNGHHLLLTARELAPLVGPPLVKTWERPVDFGVVQRLFGGHCGKLQVFVHGNATNDTSLFGNQLQAQPCRLMRWQLMDGLASKGDGSRGGRKRTRQRFE